MFEVLKGSLPEEIYELRDLRIEVPLDRWSRVVKNVNSDRKLLGGLLLDFARNKEKVGGVVTSDRLLTEFRRVVLDATVALVEAEAIVLALADKNEN